ncbi:uncharacterized protein PADG_02285 [Paracoccidioides brasiliensis Pb18]|uniref:Cytochrome P450-DIT2 n=1 Tax=Paracoccidioides brasiliensis (strain Pb18) TaxID=502780 RepID=C1G2B9_PARBD|nr:uncharacterized protein PADG_02285 [Paracoccidioides brasiliensis Pb18]EEH46135.2 hypothetical protein PADG_02285 [Paracoccidioides brasiliensis Pb18]
MALLASMAGAATIFIIVAWWYLRIPSDMPKNIPAIPFYVSSIAHFIDLGQDEIYDRWMREPLEKYGAVKFWVSSRWNVLNAKPEYINDLLRNEDAFIKAGNCEKIPYSVLAAFLGNNIISAHGETWRLYTSIMKGGIQRRIKDSSKLVDRSRQLVKAILQTQSAEAEDFGIDPETLVQRYAIYVVGEHFLRTNFEILEPTVTTKLAKLQTTIRTSVFAPLYFSFPTLDKYPYIFRSRKRAFNVVKEYEDLLYEIVQNLKPEATLNDLKPHDDVQVIDTLRGALACGKITETQFRANLKIVFVAGHEDVQHLLNSTLYALGVKIEIQQKLRKEVQSTGSIDPTPELVDSMPYLTATVFELLRLYPPLSQLINRKASRTAVLGNQIIIPQGTYVGWTAFGVHTNKAIWGNDARELIPERWGSTVDAIQAKFRKQNASGAYIPFNAHTRKCLGQAFALLQMKIALFELARSVEWTLAPGTKVKLGWLNSFPTLGFNEAPRL